MWLTYMNQSVQRETRPVWDSVRDSAQYSGMEPRDIQNIGQRLKPIIQDLKTVKITRVSYNCLSRSLGTRFFGLK